MVKGPFQSSSQAANCYY